MTLTARQVKAAAARADGDAAHLKAALDMFTAAMEAMIASSQLVGRALVDALYEFGRSYSMAPHNRRSLIERKRAEAARVAIFAAGLSRWHGMAMVCHYAERAPVAPQRAIEVVEPAVGLQSPTKIVPVVVEDPLPVADLDPVALQRATSVPTVSATKVALSIPEPVARASSQSRAEMLKAKLRAKRDAPKPDRTYLRHRSMSHSARQILDARNGR